MVDTLVDTNVEPISDARQGLWGPYWSDISTAVIVYFDTDKDIVYARTTDKGANWSVTEIEVGTSQHMACWFDKETPGDTGDLVHIAWVDSGDNEAKYVTLNVASDSLGTIRTVDSTLTISQNGPSNRVAITKAANGSIIFAFSTAAGIACYKSADNFATAGTSIADVYETGNEEDYVLLFPADVDAGDVAALFWDRSADEISLKMFDASADSGNGTWTETVIASSMVDDPFQTNMDGAVRHSDNHVLMAAHSDDDAAGDDLLTWDLTVDSIASPTITAKTAIFTDQGESAQVAVWINQQDDEVRMAYMKGGTWRDTVDVVFHISTNGMTSWGSEQAYSESAPDDFVLVQAGRTVGDAGGRYQPAFYDGDDVDIYVNETNDVEIAAAGGAEAIPFPSHDFGLVKVPGRMVAY